MTTSIALHFTHADGTRVTVQARSGQSLMKAAVAAGIDAIAADCGGCLSCATCHVIVAPDWALRLPPPDGDEISMLQMTAAPAEPCSRLACQIVLTPTLDGLGVRLPSHQY
jgi:ferredoxin, 2Fe-2S